MSKPYTSRDVIKVLTHLGFEPKKSTRGSHQSFIKTLKSGRTIIVVVPLGRTKKKPIKPGTFGSILRQAELTKKEFERILTET